jgi:trehalose 6-phosphate phosphatase
VSTPSGAGGGASPSRSGQAREAAGEAAGEAASEVPGEVPGQVAADVPAALIAAVRQLCGRRPVLLALDFDGVLAPIVERAPDARPLPEVPELVAALASADGITVALVSGRARADLATVSGLGGVPGVLLVGSHGAELDTGALRSSSADAELDPQQGLDDAARERLDRVVTALREVADRYPGAVVESKPSAGVLHTRQVARDQAAAATQEGLHAAGAIDGVFVTPGKEVVEVAVTEATKGAAVRLLREALGVQGVLYIGDDVTDETVLASLGEADVGVKVGEGETAARHRVASPEAVREVLRALVDVVRAG